MVNVVDDTNFLNDYRDDGSYEGFPGNELSTLKSAVEEAPETVFLDDDLYDLDGSMANSLPNYASEGRTEFQLWDDHGHSVDLYNPDELIAVEVEKSEQKYIWKILTKFERGSIDSKIKFGCMILPVNYLGEYNIHGHSDTILKFMAPILDSVHDVAVIGYRDPRPNAAEG